VGGDPLGQQPGLDLPLDLLALCEQDAFVGPLATISPARSLPATGGDRPAARRPACTPTRQSLAGGPADGECDGSDDDHGDDD
jgi:hypothetical protein